MAIFRVSLADVETVIDLFDLERKRQRDTSC